MGPEEIVGHVTPDQAALNVLYSNSTAAIAELRPVSISNGLIWNKENTLLYYIDTATNQVDVFDFVLERREICEFL
jgi:sugar lactone lactonase YvrE